MIRIIIAFLLALTGALAVYGGILLITDPTGYKIGLSTSILQFSPFSDFLFPGLILFMLIGIGSLLVSALVLMRTKRFATWVILMGFVLAGWISIQILMLREVQLLQVVFAVIGILLVVLGIVERKKDFSS